MNIGETFQAAHRFLTGVEASYLFGPRKETFFKVLQLVDSDICKLEKNEEIKSCDEQSQNIITSLEVLKSTVLNEPITAALFDFTRIYCLIVNNWNENVAKSNSIKNDVFMIDRFVQNHFTTNELQGLIRNLVNRLKEIQHVSLPSIELSRHYLASYDASPNKVVTGPGTIAKKETKEVKELPPAIAKRNAEATIQKAVDAKTAHDTMSQFSFNKSIK